MKFPKYFKLNHAKFLHHIAYYYEWVKDDKYRHLGNTGTSGHWTNASNHNVLVSYSRYDSPAYVRTPITEEEYLEIRFIQAL